MLDQPQRTRLDGRFNYAVFAFLAAMGIFKFLLQSDKVRGATFEGLVVSIGFDAIRYIVVVLISALIVRAFWNRLIVDIVPLRLLDYQEAIAILLVIGVLFGL